ncbi:MAG: LysM peptidoglycan-binding domain-containing protein [Verrucomicrobiota bacterium]
MKFTKVFGLVLAVHLTAASLILVQPGCKSAPSTRPTPADTRGEPTGGTTSVGSAPAPIEDEFNAGLTQPVPQRSMANTGDGMRQAPTRPAGSSGEGMRGAPLADQGFPLPPSDGDVLEPLSPGVSRTADTPPAPVSNVYEVQRGDSLWKISQQFGASVEEIKAANNLTGNTIQIGQELEIPGAEIESSPRTTEPRSEAQPGGMETTTYQVQPGDTLSGLARRFGTSIAAIKDANGMTSDMIRVGQELDIPTSGSEPTSAAPTRRTAPTPSPAARTAPAPSDGTHVVRPGETPSGIARRYGLNTDQLMEMNPELDPRRMQVGTRLQVAEADTGSPTPRAAAPTQRASATEALPSTRTPTQRPVQIGPAETGETPAEEPTDIDALFRDAPLVEVDEADEADGE